MLETDWRNQKKVPNGFKVVPTSSDIFPQLHSAYISLYKLILRFTFLNNFLFSNRVLRISTLFAVELGDHFKGIVFSSKLKKVAGLSMERWKYEQNTNWIHTRFSNASDSAREQSELPLGVSICCETLHLKFQYILTSYHIPTSICFNDF